MADEFIQDLLQADRTALRALLEETSPPLFKYLLRFLGDRKTAIDVLSEAYIELLQNVVALENEEDIHPFLWKSAHKAALKHAFSSGDGPAAPKVGISRKPSAPEFVSENPLESVRRLENAWADLDIPYREALALAGIEPLVSYDEASELIEGAKGTLRSRLAYAIRSFLRHAV